MTLELRHRGLCLLNVSALYLLQVTRLLCADRTHHLAVRVDRRSQPLSPPPASSTAAAVAIPEALTALPSLCVGQGVTFNVHRKYQLIEQIGSGSYGVVCSALNTETGQKVAIKKVTPMCKDEWDATHTLREVRIMRYLGQHPNIISLKDLSIDSRLDELYIIMELLNFDMHRLIQSSTQLAPSHIQFMMLQLIRGIKVFHDNRVYHRDLKPANLLLNTECGLRITVRCAELLLWSLNMVDSFPGFRPLTHGTGWGGWIFGPRRNRRKRQNDRVRSDQVVSASRTHALPREIHCR